MVVAAELVCSCGHVFYWTTAQGDVVFRTDGQVMLLRRPLASPQPCTCVTVVSGHELRYEVTRADLVSLCIRRCPNVEAQ
jgi:hypothetical protein